MGASSLPACILLLALGAGPDPNAATGPGRPRSGGELSAEDARYLDWLVEDFLFDPKRATYVRIVSPGAREVLSGRSHRYVSNDEVRDGWLVRGANGAPDRVYFADGESTVVPADHLQHLDFEALCAQRFGPGDSLRAAVRAQMPVARLLIDLDRFGQVGSAEGSSLVVAAWLHRRGYDRLAARALAHAREQERDDAREELRTNLARHASDSAVRAFEARADDEAVAHATRLHALYGDHAESYPNAAAVVADITRRQRAGIGSRVPPKDPPPGFATWEPTRQIAFLIESLDESERGMEFRWHFHDPTNDWRIAALHALGDAAVPALIDAVEHDPRLTRRPEHDGRIYFGCGIGSRGRRPEQVLAVRELAESIVQSILRVSHLDPTAPPKEDDEDKSPRAKANRFRQYWARYGRLPFPDRMMAILTDPSARPDARRDAAESLVNAIEQADTSWRRDYFRGRISGPSPLLLKYSRPTVAEAILEAMDRERRDWPGDEKDIGRWESIELTYLRTLTQLGDVRIGPELARRAATMTNPVRRLHMAETAYTLGVRGPIVTLARELTTGTVTLPPPADRDRPAAPQVEAAVLQLMDAVLDCGLPELDEALYAVADPGHPYFPMALQGALTQNEQRGRGSPWKRHPVCLLVLRQALSDARPTGRHSYRRAHEIEDWNGQRSNWWTPPGGADPEQWAEHVEHRVADEAMARLNELIIGLPEYFALRRDASQARTAARNFVGIHPGRFRAPSHPEQQKWLLWRYGEQTYVPDFKPLGRPATAADVAAGRAVFELKGAGRVADVKLPAWLVLKADAAKSEPFSGKVVQAEVGADGKVVYGVIFRREVRAVRADEVEKVEAEEQR